MGSNTLYDINRQVKSKWKLMKTNWKDKRKLTSSSTSYSQTIERLVGDYCNTKKEVGVFKIVFVT